MVQIMSHHRKEHPLSSDTDYAPICAWPKACTVQWGGNGLVLAEEPYGTAFFEAFPKDNAGGFIRGEGKTIEEAEKAAFAKWQREHACDHVWGREGYTNGGTFCKKCRAFTSRIMHPIVTLGEWKKPLSISELSSISMGLLQTQPHDRNDPRMQKYRRRMALRAQLAGLDLPPLPDGPEPQPKNPFEGTPYEKACFEACLLYFVEQYKRLIGGRSQEMTMNAFFKAFEIGSFKHAALKRGLLNEADFATD